jgi:ATP-dependent helicase/nuclease subunit B
VLGQGWARSVEDWRAEVEKLARGFIAGDAAVDPKTKDTCTYCQMKPFCRIAERDGSIQEWS